MEQFYRGAFRPTSAPSSE